MRAVSIDFAPNVCKLVIPIRVFLCFSSSPKLPFSSNSVLVFYLIRFIWSHFLFWMKLLAIFLWCIRSNYNASIYAINVFVSHFFTESNGKMSRIRFWLRTNLSKWIYSQWNNWTKIHNSLKKKKPKIPSLESWEREKRWYYVQDALFTDLNIGMSNRTYLARNNHIRGRLQRVVYECQLCFIRSQIDGERPFRPSTKTFHSNFIEYFFIFLRLKIFQWNFLVWNSVFRKLLISLFNRSFFEFHKSKLSHTNLPCFGFHELKTVPQ